MDDEKLEKIMKDSLDICDQEARREGKKIQNRLTQLEDNFIFAHGRDKEIAKQKL